VRTAPHRRDHRLSVWIGLACLGVALAACGSSRSPGQAASTSGDSQAIRFANCMRSRGVPNFPDPSAHGPNLVSPGSGINPQSPAFQAAQRACGGLAPGGGGPPQMSEGRKLAALAFSKCVRAHGEPDFPDPVLTAPSGATLVISLRGMLFAPRPGFDPRSPAFRQAAGECGLKLPGG
jgi:hypothetical protein